MTDISKYSSRKSKFKNLISDHFDVFAILTIFLFFACLFIVKRNTFIHSYDEGYWKDRFEHSRYALPLSQRGLGDEGLYAYAGYKAINGSDPIKIVFDKPALGIFIIGTFIKIFNNPAYSGLILGFGVIIAFYYLAKRLLKNSKLALYSSILLFLSPILFSHFYISLLDLPQLLLLLLNLIFFYDSVFGERKNKGILLLSALLLGLSFEIKIPLFLPILILLEAGYLTFKKQITDLSFYILGLIISIFISFSVYFIHGYDFFGFIKVQKYILSIYLSSTLSVHVEAIWQFLLTGSFPDISSGIPKYIQEWSIMLAVFTILGIFFSVLILFSKKKIYWKGISVFILANCLILTIIPSYPRYVLIIFPFLILVTMEYLSKILKPRFFGVFISISVIYSLVVAALYLHPKPTEELGKFYINYSNNYFQDVYEENLADDSRPDLSRTEFFNKLYSTYQDASIYSVTVKELENNISRFDTEGEVTARFTYNTYFLGKYFEDKKIKLKKEDNQWQVVWDWNYVFNDYEPEYSFSLSRDIGERGKLISSLSGTFAQDKEGYLIEFNPSLMNPDQENEMLKFLSKISRKPTLSIQNAYLENVPVGKYIPLVTSLKTLSANEIKYLNEFKGIRLKKSPARIYTAMENREVIQNMRFKECCTLIYSAENYHGAKIINNPEYIFDEQLSGQDGGKLLMLNKENEVIRTIIDKKSKNGKDVSI